MSPSPSQFELSVGLVDDATADAVAADRAIDDVLSSGGRIRSYYQPIVRIATGEIIGYEALARFPGFPGITPTAMFAAAGRRGREHQLDAACRAAATAGAAEAHLDDRFVLFVNVEIDTFEPTDLRALTRAARTRRLVLEVTERSLLNNPGLVLDITRTARELGFGVALDDVGSNADSMTMLEFIAPDIIKLDRSLLRTSTSTAGATTVAAVIAQAEHTGAQILMEGIETEEELSRAISFGATLGQGWFFGRPAPLSHPTEPPPTGLSFPVVREERPTPGRPSDLLAQRPTRTGAMAMVSGLFRNLEDQAALLRDPLTILMAGRGGVPAVRTLAQRYSGLARDNAFVALLSPDLTALPLGVRGGRMPNANPAVEEWAIAILGHFYSATLIARNIDAVGPPSRRQFEYLLSFDRALTTACARSIMRHVDGLTHRTGRATAAADLSTDTADAVDHAEPQQVGRRRSPWRRLLPGGSL